MFASAVPLFKFVQNVEHVCKPHTCHNQKVTYIPENVKTMLNVSFDQKIVDQR